MNLSMYKYLLAFTLVALIDSNCKVVYKMQTNFAPGDSIYPSDQQIIQVTRRISMSFYEIQYDEDDKPFAIYKDSNQFEYVNEDFNPNIELDMEQINEQPKQISVRKISLRINKIDNSEQIEDESFEELEKNLVDDFLLKAQNPQFSVTQSLSTLNTEVQVQETETNNLQQINISDIDFNIPDNQMPKLTETQMILKNSQDIQDQVELDMDCNLLGKQRSLYSDTQYITQEQGIIDVRFNLNFYNRQITLEDTLSSLQSIGVELQGNQLSDFTQQFQILLDASNSKGLLNND